MKSFPAQTLLPARGAVPASLAANAWQPHWYLSPGGTRLLPVAIQARSAQPEESASRLAKVPAPGPVTRSALYVLAEFRGQNYRQIDSLVRYLQNQDNQAMRQDGQYLFPVCAASADKHCARYRITTARISVYRAARSDGATPLAVSPGLDLLQPADYSSIWRTTPQASGVRAPATHPIRHTDLPSDPSLNPPVTIT